MLNIYNRYGISWLKHSLVSLKFYGYINDRRGTNANLLCVAFDSAQLSFETLQRYNISTPSVNLPNNNATSRRREHARDTYE